MGTIAIVTGATSGVGKSFVRHFDAGKGGPLDEIWAIARTEARLAELASECTHVRVRPLPADLTDPGALEAISQRLADERPNVCWLVNAAGFGTFGPFAEMEAKKAADMVRLNCLALTEMCARTLPYLNKGSRIVNLSSIAGAIPQVKLACYSATKAFVLELSRMLDHELKGTGIRVTAVCPKFMRTRFLDEPGDARAAQAMCAIGFEEVDRVVTRAITASLFGIPVLITAPEMRLAASVARHLPRRALFALEDLLFSHRRNR